MDKISVQKKTGTDLEKISIKTPFLKINIFCKNRKKFTMETKFGYVY